MSNLDALSNLAFHREHVASRRLAKRADISLDAALEQVLSEVAGVNGLPFLLEQRRADFFEQAKLKEEKRQLSQQRYISKLNAKTIPVGRWCAWFDGSARPNPGFCSIGGILQAPDGRRWQMSQLTQHGSSSVAEYQALIAVLDLALIHRASGLIVFGDSRVVIDDLAPQAKKHAQGLEQFRQIAQGLMQQLVGAQLQWIPRARNGEADALAQRAFENERAQKADFVANLEEHSKHWCA